MFKNIHINLINAMPLGDLLADKTYVVIYDNRFEAPIRNECPICEAVASVCVEFNLYGFNLAIVCDAKTGEILAELKQVNEEWEED